MRRLVRAAQQHMAWFRVRVFCSKGNFVGLFCNL
jgi:hypothetical protein